MIQLNVSQLLKETIGSTRDNEVSGAVDITGDGISSQIQGEVTLTRIDRGCLVKGRLHTEVEITCSRCLSLFGYPLALDIEEEYFPLIDVSTGSPLAMPDEPGSFTINEHHVIDLTEAIRQYALLAMPMKPLCREDCAGFNPGGGDNRNVAGRDYQPQGADHR
jgi:uncharacterized protein